MAQKSAGQIYHRKTNKRRLNLALKERKEKEKVLPSLQIVFLFFFIFYQYHILCLNLIETH